MDGKNKRLTLDKANRKLAEQWHPTRNAPLTPADVAAKSSRKVWWKCEAGHEWQTTVGKRTGGSRCPYCIGRLAWEENCLRTLNPKLAEEWHPTKNGPLRPDDVTVGCNKKVWWRCSREHEWQAVIAERHYGSGCPFCAGQRATVENCLDTRAPTIVKEWHPTRNMPLSPADVAFKSNRKVWWRCEAGHEWQSSPANRTKGHQCPFCMSRRVNKDNSLRTIQPELSEEWHPAKNGALTPDDVTTGCGKRVWWRCGRGHEWQSVIYHRSQGVGCPYCAGQRATEENCLETVNPVLAKQWHPTKNAPLTPRDVTHGSEKKVWWVCRRGHEWINQVSNRAQGAGCPYCSGRRPFIADSLATLGTWVAGQWHPTKNGWWMPKDVFPHSTRQMWWICKNGHEMREPVIDRYKRGGCPFCILKRS
ncbi:MAG: zinc-ribbon domain-containing protein [Syntrophobacteraceae bacterium]